MKSKGSALTQPVSGFTGLAVSGGSIGTATTSGSSITIPITFTGDGEISVEFLEIASSGGETEGIVFNYRVLKGDTNQDGLVDALDTSEWGYYVGNLDTVANGAHTDVNRDWQIDNSDRLEIEGNFTEDFIDFEAGFRYTGHYYHAKSGLYFAPYRAYNPVLGRWINRDPISENGGYNLYAYVGNRPIRVMDILGLRPGTDRFWPAYPNYNDHNAKSVWESIGGWLNDVFGPNANSCAARVSKGLNEGGDPIKPTKGVATNKNTDGKRYIISARELRKR